MAQTETISRKKAVWTLFFEFFKIATFVVGGGFAILVVAEDVFAKRHKWLREGELSNMLAIIQTVPGLTAGNIAIYAGYRVAGVRGALAALAGVALPSFLVITVIAMGFGMIPMENKLIQGAFLGVRTAMTGLTLVALLRIWNGSVRDKVQMLLFLAGVFAIIAFHLNPGWLIGGSLLFGIIYCMFICDRLPAAAESGETE